MDSRCALIFIMSVLQSITAQEMSVAALFVQGNPPTLAAPLELSCRADGDKIKISDILYDIRDCSSSEFRPQDPSADNNQLHISKCTGLKTCAIPANSIRRPFQPPKSACQSSATQINVIYTCIPQEDIQSMCTGFQSQNYIGYLSTPHYPMALKPGQPAAPCKCDLEATLNSRILLTLLEANLAGNSNTTDTNMDKCQIDVSKQYLEIQYNHRMANHYVVCRHKYNLVIKASQTYHLYFENPIKREAGAIWMQYSAEEQNALVKVTCYKPQVTTIAPQLYTKSNGGLKSSAFGTGTLDYRIILGIISAILFVALVIILVVGLVKYRSKLQHYMLHKYSRPKPPLKASASSNRRSVIRQQKSETEELQPFTAEAQVDVTDTGSLGKPTAHITPQLSLTGDINEATTDNNPKHKLLTDKKKYSSFKSSYIANQSATESDSDTSQSKHSLKSKHSVKSSPSVKGRAASVVSQLQNTSEASISRARQNTTESGSRTLFDDFWLRMENEQESPRSSSRLSSENTEPGQMSDLSNYEPPPRVSASLPVSQSHSIQSVDAIARPALSEDEEMDVKCVSPNIIAISPYRFISKAQTRRLSNRHNNQAPRTSSSLDSAARHMTLSELERAANRAARSKTSAVRAPISSFNHPSKLLVDMGTARKTRSLGGYTRRQSSTPITWKDNDTLYAKINKRPVARRTFNPVLSRKYSNADSGFNSDNTYDVIQVRPPNSQPILRRPRPHPPPVTFITPPPRAQHINRPRGTIPESDESHLVIRIDPAPEDQGLKQPAMPKNRHSHNYS